MPTSRRSATASCGSISTLRHCEERSDEAIWLGIASLRSQSQQGVTVMATIGFIGLGNMGAPMAANLLKAQHRVAGYDVVAAASDALAEKGGHAASGVAEA